MSIELIWAIVALALLVLALCGATLTYVLVRLVREARAALTSSQRLLGMLEDELPPTLRQLRDLTGKLDGLAGELPPRLERLDALLTESDETLAAVRSLAEATEQVARVPLDAVDRVRRTLRLGPSERDRGGGDRG
ncbi:MAG: hypothetical protein ACXWOW_05640 [Candidatus Limnocylindrales bacterium]